MEETLKARRERLEWGREQTRRELEQAKRVREAEVRSITLAVEDLEGFTTDFLEKYTDRSAPPDPINYRMWLIEWSGQFGEGIVPEQFKGGSLEHDPGKARDNSGPRAPRAASDNDRATIARSPEICIPVDFF